jgi:hypothetical protein
MPRAYDAIQAIKDACATLDEVVEILSIGYRKGNISVHLYTPFDLKKIPGEIKFMPRECGTFPCQAQKKYNGATFFCLLKEMPCALAEEAAE